MNLNLLLFVLAISCFATASHATTWSEKPLAEVQRAAEQGDAAAQYNLGLMYHYGEEIARDHKQAAHWYRQAAEQGHAYAQFNLGTLYNNGLGVAKDEKQAVHWIQKAAEQGDEEAQYSLGNMYASGLGVKKDEKKAAYWFKKATQQSNARALLSIGLRYVNKQHVQALASLAGNYEGGFGTTLDRRQAYTWLSTFTINRSSNNTKATKRLPAAALEYAQQLATRYFEQD
ncbi:MAG: tetratricopeptide repeat protein [Vibrionaceae bacterium]